MKKPEVSRFQFTNFVVRESHFALKERGDYEFSFVFKPAGKVYPTLGQFELYLDLKVRDKNGLVDIDIKTISFFTFGNEEDITKNELFTLNAPAIVYPFIRAYIATFTAPSGVCTIVMPAMHLIPLKDHLQNNMEVMS